MNCFENYIGARNCDDETSVSGHFIDDLGIGLKKLSNLANDAIWTGKEFHRLKLSESVDYCLNEVMDNYNESPSILSINEHLDNYINGSADKAGFILESRCKDAKPFIESIKLNCETDVDTTISIVDGSTTNTFNFNTADELILDYQATNRKVEVYFQDTNINPMEISRCVKESGCECSFYLNQFGNSGMEINAQLKCVDLGCRLKNDSNFARAVLYYEGVLISQEVRLSSNLNDTVLFSSSEKAEDREDIWMASVEKYLEKCRMTWKKIIDNSCCKDCSGAKLVYSI